MPTSKICQICDETGGWAGDKLLKWNLNFGVIINDAKREKERARIYKALEECVRSLGYEPEGIPLL